MNTKLLVRSVLIVCSVTGAAGILALMLSKHGFVFLPIYAGAVWGAYYLQTLNLRISWRKP